MVVVPSGLELHDKLLCLSTQCREAAAKHSITPLPGCKESLTREWGVQPLFCPWPPLAANKSTSSVDGDLGPGDGADRGGNVSTRH